MHKARTILLIVALLLVSRETSNLSSCCDFFAVSDPEEMIPAISKTSSTDISEKVHSTIADYHCLLSGLEEDMSAANQKFSVESIYSFAPKAGT